MTHIPQSDILSTTNLSRVFNSTTATYKFYWFLSLLQMHNEEGAYRMRVWDLVIRMVANAWFPIHYFHLSFDSLRDSVYGMFSELWMRHKYNLETEIAEEEFVNMGIRSPIYLATMTESVKLVEVISEAALTDYNKGEFCNLLKRLSEYIKKLKIRAYINN